MYLLSCSSAVHAVRSVLWRLQEPHANSAIRSRWETHRRRPTRPEYGLEPGRSGTPVLVALFALPPLIAGLGAERFGFLTLAWLVIGYFNLFDLGLGRALTQSIAERLGQGREEEIPGLVRTTLLAMLLLGTAGAAVLASLSPWLVRTVIRVPTALRGEAGGHSCCWPPRYRW